MAYDHLMTKGSTSQIIEFTLRDASSGQGKTAVARAAVTATYLRRGAASAVSITLGDMTAGTWLSGGWAEIDATNRPGEYALGLPDAAVADGADGVTIRIKSAGCIDKEVKLQLLAANLQAVNVPANVVQLAASTPAGTALRNMMIGDVRNTLYIGKLDISSSGNAIDITAGGSGYGINISAPSSGLRIVSTGTLQPAFYVQGGTAAVPAVAFQGGNSGGIGLQIAGGSGGYAMKWDGAQAYPVLSADAGATVIMRGTYTAPDNAGITAVKTITDHLGTALELDGAVYRFTSNALEQAPTGTGGTADWSADEKAQIRSALGVTGTQTPAATGGQLQSLPAGVWTSATRALTDKAGFSLAQGFPNNFALLAIDASGRVTVGSNADKSGYALSQAFPSNFSSLAIDASGRVTAGTVADKAGYSLAQPFPSNFASLAITSGGAVSLDDRTGFALSAAGVDAIWDEVLTSGHATADSAGVLLQKLNVTGTLANTDNANSFKADVSGLLTAAAFDLKVPQAIPFTAGKVDANATASVDTAAVADAIWDELLSGHVVDGSAGAVLAATTAGSGRGARTVTVTVNDGTNLLEGAAVRLTAGAESYVATSNASGVATLRVNDATWTLAAAKAGYSMAAASPTSVLVDGDKAVDVAMDQVTISPPALPSQTTGWAMCYDPHGLPEAGVRLEYRVQSSSDSSYSAAVQVTAPSDPAGKIEVVLARGVVYQFRRGVGAWETVTAGDAATTALPAILGR